MPKAIYRSENALLCELLRTLRDDAGLTQHDLACKVGKGQSYISDIERGVRRVDLIELRDLCHCLDISLPQFVGKLERRLRLQLKGRR